MTSYNTISCADYILTKSEILTSLPGGCTGMKKKIIHAKYEWVYIPRTGLNLTKINVILVKHENQGG